MHPVSDRAILAFGARTKRNEWVTALSQAVCNAGLLISPRWRRSGLPHCQLYAPAALRRSQRTETAVAGNRAAGFALARVPILPKMLLVEEADAGAICVLFAEQGELSYAVELRRRFPAITSNAKAREYVRTIAGSKPLPHSVARGGLPGHPSASGWAWRQVRRSQSRR